MKTPESYSQEANIAPIRQLAAASNDYRALVCVYLNGGNDSHNMVYPRNGSPNRAAYVAERGIIGLDDDGTMSLDQNWRLNGNMTNLHAHYTAGKAAFLMNVGYLKEPTDRASFLAKRVKLPDQLFSHNSQTQLWHGLPPFASIVTEGWMGRASDLAAQFYNPDSLNDVSACFSISGRPLQLQGYESGSSDMNSSGATTPSNGTALGSPVNFTAALTAARTRQEYDNRLQRLVAARLRRAIDTQTALAANMSTLASTPNARFDALSGNGLAQQLRTVARIIQSRASFAHRRDLFYVTIGGWDDHDNIATAYGPRLGTLDAALNAFFLALGDMGVQQNVVTFTESEFGRALKRNNNGTDHGWGGHAIILGGAVAGGKLYGTPPDLNPGSKNDAGQGRMIPTTSCEQYAGALLEWWGIPRQQIPLVLTNAPRFPSGIPGLLKEPAPIPVAAKTVSINVLDYFEQEGNPVSPVPLAVSGVGPRMMFDKNGKYVCAPTNLIPNSSFEGAVVGVIGEGGVLPPGWRTGSIPGLKHEIVRVGVNERGHRYIDIRCFGRNNSGSMAYPYIVSSVSPPLGSPVPAGSRVLASGRIRLVAGTPYNSTSPCIALRWSAGTTYNGEVTSPRATAEERQYHIAGQVGNSSDNVDLAFAFGGIAAATSLDVTMRLSEPQIEYTAERVLGDAKSARHYPTKGTPYNGPRFIYNPANLKPRGLLVERSSLNRITNSAFIGAVIGTPGTRPTGHTVYNPPGINTSIVDVGTEDGIPYMDLRIFGAKTDTTRWQWDLQSLLPLVPGVGAFTTVSAFAAIKGGSLSNVLYAQFISRGMIGSTTWQDSTVDFLTTGDGPLRMRKFATTKQMTEVTVDGVIPRIVLDFVQGQPVDITIRIGAPQLEFHPNHTEWMPSFGTVNGSRGAELPSLSAADLAGKINPNEGTMVCKWGMDNPQNGHLMYPSPVSLFPQGVTNSFVRMYRPSNNGSGGGRMDNAGVIQFDGSGSGGVATYAKPGETATTGVAYKTNDSVFSQKGFVSTPDTSCIVPAGLNTLNFGTEPNGNSGRVWIASFDYYPVRVSDTQLSLLTTG